MSGLIPQIFISELLSRIDIVGMIDSYLPLKKTGHDFTACCPFHQEKSPSFYVIPAKQFYHCFGCGANGNAISFVMQFLHQGFVEAVETLASRVGLQMPVEGPQNTKPSKQLHLLLAEVNAFYQHCLKQSVGKAAVDYLRSRGVDGLTAKQYQLGYAPEGWHTLDKQFKAHKEELIETGMLIQREGGGSPYDRYRHRVIFPIHNRQGHIVGFGGRALDKKQRPKYLNSPETLIFQKSRELYGLHQILQKTSLTDVLVVVEGYMDVIALAQKEGAYAVATLGTATSSYHIQWICRYTKQLIFCFDGDAAGRQAAWRGVENCLPHLDQGLDIRFAFLPEGHDPDSFIRQENGKNLFKELIAHALPFNRFFLDTLTMDLDLSSSAGKSQLIKLAQPYLNKIQESPYKQLLLDEIGQISRIETYRLSHLVSDKNAAKTPPVKQTILKRSPLRLALALVVQYPQLFKDFSLPAGDYRQGAIFEVEREQMGGLHLGATQKAKTLAGDKEKTGLSLLAKLMEAIKELPEVNTAILLEAWRHTPWFKTLAKLAVWDHQIPTQSLQKEFKDIVFFLQKQDLEYKINKYIMKSRSEGLTLSEKMQLQTLLKHKHHAGRDKGGV
ncbi:MAG: DNA primase [Legionella sp.]|nr:DNA primase [Legionella sp.]